MLRAALLLVAVERLPHRSASQDAFARFQFDSEGIPALNERLHQDVVDGPLKIFRV